MADKRTSDTEWRRREPKEACKEMKQTGRKNFDVYEHVHRFAAWAASRAASRGAHGFPVVCGIVMIEHAGLRKYLRHPNTLPKMSWAMDKKHEEWRKSIKEAGGKCRLNITDGIAAKLINVYFKAGLVTCANKDDERVGALHPPIDSLLLKALRKSDERSDQKSDRERAKFWRSKEKTGAGWSSFNAKSYQEVIDEIRKKLGDEKRLWMIEEYWLGHQ